METKSQNIISFNLKKEEIISLKGEVFWDIGFITNVGEVIKKTGCGVNTIYIANKTSLGANKLDALKSVFDAKSISPKDFFENDKNVYAIVKVLNVEDIRVRIDSKMYQHDVTKFYLSASIGGQPAYCNPMSFLNKDYRWVNYWNWINENGVFEEKRKKYLRLLNRRDKTLYFILYRHHFGNGNNNYWISGMHWL